MTSPGSRVVSSHFAIVPSVSTGVIAEVISTPPIFTLQLLKEYPFANATVTYWLQPRSTILVSFSISIGAVSGFELLLLSDSPGVLFSSPVPFSDPLPDPLPEAPLSPVLLLPFEAEPLPPEELPPEELPPEELPPEELPPEELPLSESSSLSVDVTD